MPLSSDAPMPQCPDVYPPLPRSPEDAVRLHRGDERTCSGAAPPGASMAHSGGGRHKGSGALLYNCTIVQLFASTTAACAEALLELY